MRREERTNKERKTVISPFLDRFMCIFVDKMLGRKIATRKKMKNKAKTLVEAESSSNFLFFDLHGEVLPQS